MSIPSYKQHAKIKSRAASLKYAVKMLTRDRSNACCVSRQYVRAVKRELLRRGTPYDREVAEKLPDSYIRGWEQFHDGHVGKKKPNDLVVCYLAGPEPLNDFRLLVSAGVHPHNIWAFESDKDCYEAAVTALKDSEFPMLKIHRGSIEKFFLHTPKKFDIIYLDACGPLPSSSDRTLRVLATALRYQRLASPGVLLTNFSCPDITDPTQAPNYAYLIASYLYPKEFIEGRTRAREPVAIEGPIFQGWSLQKEDEEERSFEARVRTKFNHYYGQYITRQIQDLASVVIPWLRFANSDYWNEFFTSPPAKVADAAGKMQSMDDATVESESDPLESNLIVEPSEYSLQWTFCAMNGGGRKASTSDNNFPTPPPSITRLRNTWENDLCGFPLPTINARTAIECTDVIRTSKTFWSERLLAAVAGFDYRNQMFQFCDVPMDSLALDVILNQLAYPMHYVAEAGRRWRYKAKSTEMFVDVTVLDECRYIYEWLPTLDLVQEGFIDLGQQLSYRFALDGLAKQRRWYNNEYFYGAAVVDQFRDGFTAKVLRPRQRIGQNEHDAEMES